MRFVMTRVPKVRLCDFFEQLYIVGTTATLVKKTIIMLLENPRFELEKKLSLEVHFIKSISSPADQYSFKSANLHGHHSQYVQVYDA